MNCFVYYSLALQIIQVLYIQNKQNFEYTVFDPKFNSVKLIRVDNFEINIDDNGNRGYLLFAAQHCLSMDMYKKYMDILQITDKLVYNNNTVKLLKSNISIITDYDLNLNYSEIDKLLTKKFNCYVLGTQN